MSERYQKLFALSENLYAESAPLLIAEGALFCAAAVYGARGRTERHGRGRGRVGRGFCAQGRTYADPRRGDCQN